MTRKKLVAVAKPIADRAAAKYAGVNLTDGEIAAASDRGIELALSRFEAKHGYEFSTYVTWWIEQSIVRAILARADADGNERAVNAKLSRRMRQRRA